MPIKMIQYDRSEIVFDKKLASQSLYLNGFFEICQNKCASFLDLSWILVLMIFSSDYRL